ncbi:MAG: SCO1664 family protein [Chloroflexi bacterium]|nr:SCO1664 family protein [Chloroflexota bacterium]MDA1146582.1 SCO1664 family protein [Chloroflexota bacterium]MQC82728.1 SCO1664 family protein [Chloroflexota bacterium]
MATETASLRNSWMPADPRVPDALRDAEITQLRLIYDSSNYVFLADLQHDELGPGLGVYKPERGEQPLHDFPYGTLYQREIAAYEVSLLLGWDLIPPTVERDGEHGVGSMQLFIEHDPGEHYFAVRERDSLDEQFVRFAAFDLIANNADRKGGHLLLDVDDRIWGIDNGLCFNSVEKLRTVIWDYAGTELPAAWVEDIRRLRTCVAGADETSAPFRDRLAGYELEAFATRCDALASHPVLPQMYPYRCVPWPLI